MSGRGSVGGLDRDSSRGGDGEIDVAGSPAAFAIPGSSRRRTGLRPRAVRPGPGCPAETMPCPDAAKFTWPSYLQPRQHRRVAWQTVSSPGWTASSIAFVPKRMKYCQRPLTKSVRSSRLERRHRANGHLIDRDRDAQRAEPLSTVRCGNRFVDTQGIVGDVAAIIYGGGIQT
jgi:hypothetical protein